jgi:hypothetical protein
MPTRLDLPPPPVALDDPGGGGSEWVPLITADNDIDAHLLEGRLNQAGVEVRSIKDRSGPVWMHGGSNPWAPVAIWVRRFQLDDSRIVLAELSYRWPSAPRTDRSETVRTGWPALAWWAVAIALGILFTGIGLARMDAILNEPCTSAVCDPP